MDPITAFAMVVKSITDMITEIVKGQTPEQKQKIWDWYIADVERWRKFFKLEG
jgi:hypothetical protein